MDIEIAKITINYVLLLTVKKTECQKFNMLVQKIS
jgi:hypothetical protein